MRIILEFLWSCNWKVTGSAIIIKVEIWNKIFTILNDAWKFQWSEKENIFYWDKYNIDKILITHSHLDHIWRLISMVKNSNNIKEVIANYHTLAVLKIMNEDNYKIMLRKNLEESNLKIPHKSSLKSLKRNHNRWEFDEDLASIIENPLEILLDKQWIELLFSEEDLNKTNSLLRPIDRKKWKKLSNEIYVKQYASWHALGSSFVYKIWECENEKNICFTWDLWPQKTLIPWEKQTEIPEEELDILVIESTYWDRNRENVEDSIKEFYDKIKYTINNWWNAILPTFAFDKLQKLVELVYRWQAKWKIQNSAKIYYETSLWEKIMPLYTWIFGPYKNIHKAKKLDYNNRDKVLKKWGNIFFITWWMDIERWSWVNYLNELQNPKNLWLSTNFIENSTSWYDLVENQPKNKEMHWIIYNIKTDIWKISWFSGHKDQADLLRYIEKIEFKPWAKIIINHWTKKSMEVFKEKILEKYPNLKVELAECNSEILV